MGGDAQERRIDEAAQAMDDTARELAEHRDRLTEDIEDARRASREAREAQQVSGFSGDFEDAGDRAGGDSAEAFDDTGERREEYRRDREGG